MQKWNITFLLLLTSASVAQSTPPSSINGLSVSPAFMEFDDTEIHTGSLSQPLTITNTGNDTITGLGMELDGNFTPISTSECFTLAPQQSCYFDVSFSPESLGRKTATLLVHSSVGDVGMTLTGFAVKPSEADTITYAVALGPTFTQSVTTRAATTDVDDPRPAACESGTDSRIQTVWYRFQPPANGWLQMDTRGSDFDTMVSIWSGPPAALTFNACDDNEKSGVGTSMLALPVSSATEYYIMVAGRTSADTGILTFTSTFQSDQAIQQQEVITGTVAPGQSSTFKVNAQFPADTNLSVSVSPASSTISCTATPNQLQFYGAGERRNAEVLVKCTTAGPNASLVPPPSPHNWHPLLLAGTCFAIFFAGRKKRSVMLALIATVLFLGSCGGGGTSITAPSGTNPSGGTAGTSGGTSGGTTGGTSGGTTSGTSGGTTGTTGATSGTSGGSPSTAPGTYTVSLTGSPQPIVSSPMTLVVH